VGWAHLYEVRPIIKSQREENGSVRGRLVKLGRRSILDGIDAASAERPNPVMLMSACAVALEPTACSGGPLPKCVRGVRLERIIGGY